MTKAEKIFVKIGAGRHVPLPVPGSKISVPAEGCLVPFSMAVRRLLNCGDLVRATAPEKAAPAKASAPAKAPAALTDDAKG